MTRMYIPLVLRDGSAIMQDGKAYVMFASLLGYEAELGPEKIAVAIGVEDSVLYIVRFLALKWQVTGTADHPVIATTFQGLPENHMAVAKMATEALEWYKLHPLPYLPGWEFRTFQNFVTSFLAVALGTGLIYFFFGRIVPVNVADFVAKVHMLLVALTTFAILPSSPRPEDFGGNFGWLLGISISALLWAYTGWPAVTVLIDTLIKGFMK